MKDRIIQFLKENNLTSTKFADVIGVQRSSISHLLSGRNKPSFDFIEKMLLSYPDINAQWLITGKGDMLINQPSLFEDQKETDKNVLTARELDIQNPVKTLTDINKSDGGKEIAQISDKIDVGNTNIEKVMIFYSNGTFKAFNPE